MRRTIFLFILFNVLENNQAFTQNSFDKSYFLVDSLDLDKISDADSVLLYSSLGKFHNAKDDTSKLNAIENFVKQSYDDNIWPLYNNWAYYYASSKLVTEKNIDIQKRLKVSIAGALNNKGYFCSLRGDFENALDNYMKSLKIEDEIGNKEGVATTYNNIGMAYSNQGNVSLALEFHEKALKIREEIDNKYGIATSLNNIGILYDDQDDKNKALDYYLKALNLYNEIEEKHGEGTIMTNIGSIYSERKQFDSAIVMYKYDV